MKKCKLIDTHAHLDFDDLANNLDEILAKSQDAGVEKIIIPGVNLEDTPKIINLIDSYDNLFGAVGIHPSETKNWHDGILVSLKDFASHPKIVAIGEIGLDYYWDRSFVDQQKAALREQMKLAGSLGLPVIIHNRDAHADTLKILTEFPEIKGVMHCFSGSAEFAMQCVGLGYYIALGGPVTFRNAKKPKEVAQKVPLDMLLLETDSPFLAPHPYRGKQNNPSLIRLVAESIADLKGLSLEEVAEKTSENAKALFDI